MSSASLSPKSQRTILALLAAAGLAYAQWKGWLPKDLGRETGNGGFRPSPNLPDSVNPSPAPPVPETTRQRGEWVELGGCRLVEDRGNDGDSFVITHHGTARTMRLYFVDCPEKYLSRLNEQRVSEQGQYFGGLSAESTVRIGENARDFTLSRLRAEPFTVLTKNESVFDSERIYAFVAVGGTDLGETLVREGLARIHTKGANRPAGASMQAEKQKLQSLEREAKKAGRGAWALR